MKKEKDLPSGLDELNSVIETQKGTIAGLEATVNALKSALYDGKNEDIKVKLTKIYVFKYFDEYNDSEYINSSYHLTEKGACKAGEEFKASLFESKNLRIKEIEDEIEEAKKTDDNDEIEQLQECLIWEQEKSVLGDYKFKIEEVEVKE